MKRNSDTFCIEIGKTVIEVSCEDTYFIKNLKKIYSKWISNKKPDLKIKIRLAEKRLKTLVTRKNLIDNLSFSMDLNTAEATNKLSYFKLKKNKGTIFLGQKNFLSALSIFLITAFNQYGLNRQYYLFHASGIVYKDYAWVFSGPSGEGKSTIATLSKCKNIGQEAILITKSDEGFTAHSTPFSDISLPKQSFPIKNLIFLKKDKENELIKLNDIDKYPRIYEGLLLSGYLTNCKFNGKKRICSILLKKVFEDFRDIDVYLLKFNKSIDIKELISNTML